MKEPYCFEHHQFVGIVPFPDCSVFNPTLHNMEYAVEDELNHMPFDEGSLLSQATIEWAIVAHSIQDATMKRVTCFS